MSQLQTCHIPLNNQNLEVICSHLKQKYMQQCPQNSLQIFQLITDCDLLQIKDQQHQFNIQLPQDLINVIIQMGNELEQYLNVYGCSIYSYPLWRFYLSILLIFKEYKHNPQYDETVQENFRKICTYIPLKNSDLCKVFLQLYPNQALDAPLQERLSRYIEQYEHVDRGDPARVLELELYTFAAENISSRYLATRYQYQLEVLVQQYNKPIVNLYACLKLLSINYVPYYSFVEDFFQKTINSAILEDNQKKLSHQAVNQQSLALSFIQRNFDNYQNKLCFCQILVYLTRQDLSQQFCYQLYNDVIGMLDQDLDNYQVKMAQDVLIYLLAHSLEINSEIQQNGFVKIILEKFGTDQPFLRRVLNIYIQNKKYKLSKQFQEYIQQTMFFGQLLIDYEFYLQLQNDNEQLNQLVCIKSILHTIQQVILEILYQIINYNNVQIDGQIQLLQEQLSKLPESQLPQDLVVFLLIDYQNGLFNGKLEQQYILKGNTCQLQDIIPNQLIEVLQQYFNIHAAAELPIGVYIQQNNALQNIFDQEQHIQANWPLDHVQGGKINLAEKLEYPPTTPQCVVRFLDRARTVVKDQQNERNCWLFIENDKNNQKLKLLEVVQMLLNYQVE